MQPQHGSLCVDEESFLKCNLRLDGFEFAEKPPEKYNGWVDLIIRLSAAEGKRIPFDTVIALDYLGDPNVDPDEKELMFDMYYPVDFYDDGSGISYPLVRVLKQEEFSGSAGIKIACKEHVMALPQNYSLRAYRKGSMRML